MALRDEAYTLLGDFGKTLTLQVITNGAYDPSTGISAVTTTTESVMGCLVNYSNYLQAGSGLIKRGDRRALLRAKGMTAVPKQGDRLVDGSTNYEIVEVQKVEDSGVAVIYACQVRA